MAITTAGDIVRGALGKLLVLGVQDTLTSGDLQTGMDTLNKHAIEGYTGKAGVMPAKGGRVDLTDQSVINAVEHMVSLVK